MRSITLTCIALLPILDAVRAGTGTCKASSTTSAAASGASGTSATASAVSTVSTDTTGATTSTSASTTSTEGKSQSTSVSVSLNTSASASAATSTGGLVLANPSDACTCGYKIISLNDEYFPYKFSLSFSSLSDRTFSSVSDLLDHGFIINVDRHAGGPSDDSVNANQCWGAAENLAIKDGVLTLTTPAQSAGPNMKCAEISHNISTTGGVFQFEAQLDDTPGTCQAFWLNHTNPTQYGDEYDIEIISGTITEANSAGTGPGMYYSNWPADGDPNKPLDLKSNYTLVPFPSGIDPTTSYNNYTIAWLANSSTRYFNGAAENSPTTNLAQHPQHATINCWSNGAAGWSAGPPTTDVTMRVKSVLFYYKTEEQDGLISGCTADQACPV